MIVLAILAIISGHHILVIISETFEVQKKLKKICLTVKGGGGGALLC